MPAHDPMTRIYHRHSIPEETADRAPGGMRCGDAMRVIAGLCDTIDELCAENADLKADRDAAQAAKDAAFEEGKREGRRSVLDGTAATAQWIVEQVQATFAADDLKTPDELVDACCGPRGRRHRKVTVDVDGQIVTVAVMPGVADPYEVWRDLLREHGRKARTA